MNPIKAAINRAMDREIDAAPFTDRVAAFGVVEALKMRRRTKDYFDGKQQKMPQKHDHHGMHALHRCSPKPQRPQMQRSTSSLSTLLGSFRRQGNV